MIRILIIRSAGFVVCLVGLAICNVNNVMITISGFVFIGYSEEMVQLKERTKEK